MEKDFNAKAAQKPTFDSSITCPICSAQIPAVKMDVRFLARYTCPRCGNSVLIEGDKPQA
jgi:transposase-like protein